MSIVYRFIPALLLVAVFSFCKNQSSSSTAPPPDPVVVRNDTVMGFEGCDRASIKVVKPDLTEFIYQNYTVQVAPKTDGPGEVVVVKYTNTLSSLFTVPMPDAGYFHGMWADYMFVDAGTGPDGREITIFNLKDKTREYTSAYCDTLMVLPDGKLWFYVPGKEDEMKEKPDCPQQAEWASKGLGVGYGQRTVYNLRTRSLTRKSEWKCHAKQ